MRKHFLYLFLSLVIVQTINAQTRGTKVGYIDMEYILQNVPDYTEATIQLEQKAQKWKQEIEANYKQIKKDIILIIETELERIKNDPDLQHLVQKDN